MYKTCHTEESSRRQRDLEQKDFNHFFRITETVALRIKNPKAIVQFELEK